MLQMSREESYKINYVRGIASVRVVCIHSAPSTAAQIWIRLFIRFSAAMFLFLSGFLLKRQKWNSLLLRFKRSDPFILFRLAFVFLPGGSKQCLLKKIRICQPFICFWIFELVNTDLIFVILVG